MNRIICLPRCWLLSSAVLMLQLVGCTAYITEKPPVPGDVPPVNVPPVNVPPTIDPSADPNAEVTRLCANQAFDPGAAPMSRLTALEYSATTADLLGPVGTVPLGLESSSDGLNVSQALAEQYVLAAEALTAALRQSGRLLTVVPCNPATAGEESCGRAFIAAFGQRAFRRPLTDAEKARYLTLYRSEPAGTPFADRLEVVASGLLLSPHFLYRPEFGNGAHGVVKLTDFELATRLSYFLWGSMPDDPLLAAAAAGALSADFTPHVDRVLRDLRARPKVTAFHERWLGLSNLENIRKNPAAVGGGFTEAIHLPLFQKETEMFFNHVIWEGAGDLTTLMTADFTFANRDLATYYGTSGGIQGALPAGAAFERVALDPTKRLGFLSQAGLFTAQPDPAKANPILRGVAVRSGILCAATQPPPPGVDTSLTPTGTVPTTTRGLVEQVTSAAACTGCHSLINPVGFTFEHYDLVGRWRETDNGIPVDASGVLVGFAETALNGRVVGLPELARKLGTSRQFSNCYAQTWFTQAFGRPPAANDGCTLATLQRDFTVSHGNVQSLIRSIAMSEAFGSRRND